MSWKVTLVVGLIFLAYYTAYAVTYSVSHGGEVTILTPVQP